MITRMKMKLVASFLLLSGICLAAGPAATENFVDDVDIAPYIMDLTAVKLSLTEPADAAGRSLWQQDYERVTSRQTRVQDVCDSLMPALIRLSYDCARLMACSQEPRDQIAGTSTTATLYFTPIGPAMRSSCHQQITYYISSYLRITGPRIRMEVSPSIIKAIRFELGCDWERAGGSTEEVIQTTMKTMFELRNDLFSRWFGSSNLMKAFAISCFEKQEDYNEGQFHAYFDVTNLDQENIYAHVEQLKRISSVNRSKPATETYVSNVFYIGLSLPGQSAESQVCDFRFVEEEDRPVGTNYVGHIMEVSTLTISAQEREGVKLPWQQYYESQTSMQDSLPVDPCDVVLPLIRPLQLSCTAWLVGCGPQGFYGNRINLFFRFENPVVRSACFHNVKELVVRAIENRFGEGKLTVVENENPSNVMKFRITGNWAQPSTASAGVKLPLSNILLNLRKNFYTRWNTVNRVYPVAAVNCLSITNTDDAKTVSLSVLFGMFLKNRQSADSLVEAASSLRDSEPSVTTDVPYLTTLTGLVIRQTI
ncbi:hypothetical protein CRM22_004591 [Opisthorchis felineus]|uniref:SEA domain-containing protein n=1 Tax=Opisthorchis felineus TaxID=147828 RepID=A0A4S2LWB5_OPIFE|nr:hypothetical protein CRM22_004591 [Opisthorchis felineus]